MYSPVNNKLYSPFPMSPVNTSCPPMEQSYSTTSQNSQYSTQSFSFADVFPSSGPELDVPFDKVNEFDFDFGFEFDFSPPSPSPHIPGLYALDTAYRIPIPSNASPDETRAFTPSTDESLLYHFGTSASSSESPKSSKPYACTCGKAFTRAADLKRHQTSVHYPVYQDCPVEGCSRKNRNGFPRRDHLIEHLRSYHHLDLPKRRMTKRIPRST